MAIAHDSVAQKKKKQQLFELDTHLWQQFRQVCWTSLILNFVAQQRPEILVKKMLTVGCDTNRVLVQKMTTEFLTSKVFVHTDFVRMYILSKICMSNIMFLRALA